MNIGKKQTRKLYVIGNGFDLHHHLPTRYSDFHIHLHKNNKDLEDEIFNYFELSENSAYLWANFERDLSTFDYKGFYDSYDFTDVTSDDFKLNEISGLEDELEQRGKELVQDIQEAFEDWVNDIELDKAVPKIALRKSDLFLNFNYTTVLEDVYNIPEVQILHIHGSTLLGSRSLFFGHDVALEEIPVFDKDGEPTRTPFGDSEALSKYPFNAFQKPVTEILKENEHFFTSLDQIDKVVILGHSLGCVDLPYFKKISSQLPDTSWEVGYYSERDKSSRLSILKGISQANERIKMFRF